MAVTPAPYCTRRLLPKVVETLTAVELQPLIDLATGAVVGAEALMRPVDEDRIRHDPMLAATMLTMAAASTVCPTIWVNVEPHHINDHVLQQRLLQIAHFYGLHVTIEITERGPLPTAGTIDALHILGFTVALDDVTPHNLAAAVNLGADIIKIGYSDHDNIAASAQHVANAGQTLVVEGIETAAQHTHARTAGAHIGQGFHYHTTQATAS